MDFDVIWLAAAFGGGIFGAAIGALPVFVLCGIAAIVGPAVALATGNGAFTGDVAFGPMLGPHISFAGGVAATVYAAKIGKLPSGGKDITAGLMGLNSPDVLLVGGAFGALGYVIFWLLGKVPTIGDQPWTNTVALTVVISAIIARLLFGSTGVFGKVRAGDNRWRSSATAAWVPWMSHPNQLLVIGLGLALGISWVTMQVPATATLWFGFAGASLVFLQFGTKMPVWHHIALATETAVIASGGNMWWGVAFGLGAVFLGEIFAMLFVAHGDSHIDPPACALAVSGTMIAVLTAAGAFKFTGDAVIVLAVVVAAVGYGAVTLLRQRPNPSEAGIAAAA